MDRNKPERDGTSRLSAYLHFGHIGPHTVALAVQKADAPKAAKEAFLEQLIVRRELAINFVRFNPDYDNFESGTPGRTRAWPNMPPIHEKSFQSASWKTRRRMIRCGMPPNANGEDRLHAQLHAHVLGQENSGVEQDTCRAFQMAVYLNDKYELDGRDPNGYAGIAWAIVGNMTVPGSSGQSLARSATCHSTALEKSSTARAISERWKSSARLK